MRIIHSASPCVQRNQTKEMTDDAPAGPSAPAAAPELVPEPAEAQLAEAASAPSPAPAAAPAAAPALPSAPAAALPLALPPLPAELRHVTVEAAVIDVVTDSGLPAALTTIIGHFEEADELSVRTVIEDINERKGPDRDYCAALLALDRGVPAALGGQTFLAPGLLPADMTAQFMVMKLYACVDRLKRLKEERDPSRLTGGEGVLATLGKALGKANPDRDDLPPLEAHLAKDLIANAIRGGCRITSQPALQPGGRLLALCRQSLGCHRRAGDPHALARWPATGLKAEKFDTMETRPAGRQAMTHKERLLLKVRAVRITAHQQLAPMGVKRAHTGGGFMLSDRAGEEFEEHIEALSTRLAPVSLEAHLDRVEEYLYTYSETNDLTLTLERGIEFSDDLYRHRPLEAPTSVAAAAMSSTGLPLAATGATAATGAPATTGNRLTVQQKTTIKRAFKAKMGLAAGVPVLVDDAGNCTLGTPQTPRGNPKWPRVTPGAPPAGYYPPSGGWQPPPFMNGPPPGSLPPWGGQPVGGPPHPPPGPPPGTPPQQLQGGPRPTFPPVQGGNPNNPLACSDWARGECTAKRKDFCRFRHAH